MPENKYTDQLLDKSDNIVEVLKIKNLSPVYDPPLFIQNLCTSLGKVFFLAMYDDEDVICYMVNNTRILIIKNENSMTKYQISLFTINNGNISSVMSEECEVLINDIQETISKILLKYTNYEYKQSDGYKLIHDGESEFIAITLNQLLTNDDVENNIDTETFLLGHLNHETPPVNYLEIWEKTIKFSKDDSLIGKNAYRLQRADSKLDIYLPFTMSKENIKRFCETRGFNEDDYVMKIKIENNDYYPLYKLAEKPLFSNYPLNNLYDTIKSESEIIAKLNENYTIIPISSF